MNIEPKPDSAPTVPQSAQDTTSASTASCLIPERRIHNTAELLLAVENAFGETCVRYPWFRGHSSSEWQLVPSVHRDYDFKEECRMTLEFVTRTPMRYPNFPDPSDAFTYHARWLSLMQHYRLPTRLLDWTASPLVAAFFATRAETPSGNAAIWYCSPDGLNQAFSKMTNLVPLASKAITTLTSPPFFNKPTSGDRVVAVLADEVDLRMTVQQSRFTIHGTPKPLESYPHAPQFLRKLLIPKDYLPTFQTELSVAGITLSTLFPDLEHLAQEIAATTKKRKNPPSVHP